METIDKLKEVLHNVAPDLSLDGVTASTRLGDDLGIDSMRMLMMTILLEDATGVRFSEKVRFETVGDVVKYIDRQQAEKENG